MFFSLTTRALQEALDFVGKKAGAGEIFIVLLAFATDVALLVALIKFIFN
jgi:hypothetical protein